MSVVGGRIERIRNGESMRIARGIIAFEYIVEDDPYAEGLEGDELVNYFTDTMLDDVIDLRFSDIRPAIEMEILEATPIGKQNGK